MGNSLSDFVSVSGASLLGSGAKDCSKELVSVSSPEPRSLRMSLTAAETSGNSVLELVKKEETGASVTGMLSSMAWSLAKAVMRSDRSGSSFSADTNLTGLGKFLDGDLILSGFK